MNTAAVVEQLNVVKESRLCLLTSCKVTVVNQLVFQVNNWGQTPNNNSN